MTTVENHSTLSSAADDLYHSDDADLRDKTPPLRPMKVNLEPSPSPPPAEPLPQPSPDSSPGPPNRKSSNRSKRERSQGYGVLVAFMDGGKRPDIARHAAESPLASEDEQEEPSMKGTNVDINADLAAIASAASALANVDQIPRDVPELAQVAPPINGFAPNTVAREGGEDRMEDIKPTIPSITATGVGDLRLSPEIIVKSEIKPPPDGELPPILQQSPKSGLSNGNGNSSITLPGIAEIQLGGIDHLSGEIAPPIDPILAQSPSAHPLHRFPAIGHGSPPKSPNDLLRRELPSPGRGPGPYYYNTNSHRRPSQADTPYTNPGDYSSSNTETPSTDQSTPANLIDRMSIDGITNPQIGGFQCSHSGCNAQPFQTQYLLNSHANVHSSNRPHYCSVKGCPRSEGGKGFKRKNEMIRHGLVHESPGYVCPFCPDREHKYPRPDNLQRHVRVHHMDKDKDDRQLRDVLSQRPEGLSKGRRRRGGTS